MISFNIDPGKLAWNLKITQLKRKVIFQTSIFGFHINFSGQQTRFHKSFTAFGVESLNTHTTYIDCFHNIIYIYIYTYNLIPTYSKILVSGIDLFAQFWHILIGGRARYFIDWSRIMIMSYGDRFLRATDFRQSGSALLYMRGFELRPSDLNCNELMDMWWLWNA